MTRFALCPSCQWPIDECDCARAERAAEQARARANDGQRTSRRGPDGKPSGYVRAFVDSLDEPQIAVPCRKCGNAVEISEWVAEQAGLWSAMLIRRGEEPLRQEELQLCADCRELHEHDQRTRQELELLERDERWKRTLERGELGRYDADWLRRHGFREDVFTLESVIRDRKAKPARPQRAPREAK